MDVGWRLKELLKEKNVLQKNLATHLNVGSAYISDVIHGKKVPIDTLSSICDYLGVSLSEFFQPFANNDTKVPSYIKPILETCKNIKSKEAAEALLPMIRFLASEQNFAPALEVSQKNTEVDTETEEENAEADEDEEPKYYLPLLGGAAAGSPIYHPADDGDQVEIPERYADPERYAVFQARGDSMEPRIPDGSFIVTEVNALPSEGEVAVVMLSSFSDAEYVVKRIYPKRNSVILRSYNPKYTDMTISADEVRSVYRMVEIIR